jgi:hypothetical protein
VLQGSAGGWLVTGPGSPPGGHFFNCASDPPPSALGYRPGPASGWGLVTQACVNGGGRVRVTGQWNRDDARPLRKQVEMGPPAPCSRLVSSHVPLSNGRSSYYGPPGAGDRLCQWHPRPGSRSRWRMPRAASGRARDAGVILHTTPHSARRELIKGAPVGTFRGLELPLGVAVGSDALGYCAKERE